MTRIVTGQFDAVIEVGSRLIDEVPGMREEFERVGGGQVLNNSPYDLAAPWLCLTEAGGVVSDGWGEPLDRCRLLGIRPRVPDVVDLRLERRGCTRSWCERWTRESRGCAALAA